MRHSSETGEHTPEQTAKDICRTARKYHSAEDAAGKVMERLRSEYSIAGLFRREGIAVSLHSDGPRSS